jgi:hypothetical protein
MKTHINNSISPIDFYKSLKYYFFNDLNVGDELRLRYGNQHKNNSDNLSNFKYSLSYDVFKGYEKNFQLDISLMKMLSSSIEGVSFYEYKITNKEISWEKYFQNGITTIYNVTPLPNIITGDKFIYPAFKYEGYKEFEEETQQFQHITNETLIKLYSSKVKIEFHPLISYFRSIDFSYNAPFSWVFEKNNLVHSKIKYNFSYGSGTVFDAMCEANKKNGLH